MVSLTPFQFIMEIKIKHKLFLGFIYFCGAAVVFASKPNVIVMADDLGWMDIVCNAVRVKTLKLMSVFMKRLILISWRLKEHIYSGLLCSALFAWGALLY